MTRFVSVKNMADFVTRPQLVFSIQMWAQYSYGLNPKEKMAPSHLGNTLVNAISALVQIL